MGRQYQGWITFCNLKCPAGGGGVQRNWGKGHLPVPSFVLNFWPEKVQVSSYIHPRVLMFCRARILKSPSPQRLHKSSRGETIVILQFSNVTLCSFYEFFLSISLVKSRIMKKLQGYVTH